MTVSQQRVLYCSDCSRQVGEQLFGTAPRTDVWLLLEYVGTWGNKALPESDLPQSIKDCVNGWLEHIPNTKFQFIKHVGQERDGIAFFVALSSETDPYMYQFRLESYDDLLSLDVSTVIERSPAFEMRRRDTPIYIVCTNGKRDAACAQYGPPVFREFVNEVGDAVWQCTHIGGHRFAATFACLPEGVCYGHVDADDVTSIIGQHQRGEIVVAKTRGRSCYDAPVQAADYYLRGITGIREITRLRLASVTQVGDEEWRVRFHALHDDTQHEIHLMRRLSEWISLESTSDLEMKHFPQFHLVAHIADVDGNQA
jgi:hypothetical protein